MKKGHWKGDPGCSMTPKTGRPVPSTSSRPSSSTAAARPHKEKGKGASTRQADQTFFMRDVGSLEATNSPEYAICRW